MAAPTLELVSFDLCPYVHRSVITLKHKKAPYTLKEIDLQNPPDWFLKISPMGRVPVLVVDGKTSIFESAVINEFIDDVTSPKLSPEDPLARAVERSWIAFTGELLTELYAVTHAKNGDEEKSTIRELFLSFAALEPVLAKKPYFNGEQFSLVDTSFAPLFVRLNLIPRLSKNPGWAAIPKVKAYADTLLNHPAVLESVTPEFKTKFEAYVRETSPWLFA